MKHSEKRETLEQDTRLNDDALFAVGGGRGSFDEGAGRMVQCGKCRTYFSTLEPVCPKCGAPRPRAVG